MPAVSHTTMVLSQICFKNKLVLRQKMYDTVLGPIPIVAFHDYKIKKTLGSGNYGDAFLTNDNQVLKITIEKGEHLWAKEMVGRKCTHVVDVYDTWKYNLDR